MTDPLRAVQQGAAPLCAVSVQERPASAVPAAAQPDLPCGAAAQTAPPCAQHLPAEGRPAPAFAVSAPPSAASAAPPAAIPQLDARLQAVADQVPAGARVADVGCDHGKLAVYLAAAGRAAAVLAIDVRPQPLARARQLAASTGCGQLVECRLADGLSCVAPGEADTVILAGISGITAAQILTAAPWTRQSGVTVLAVPANKPEVLRRFFAENGYAIVREQPVLAGGRPYAVLTAHGGATPFVPTPLWCWLGMLAAADGEAALACRRAALHRLQRRMEGEEKSAQPDAAALTALRQLIAEVEPLCR